MAPTFTPEEIAAEEWRQVPGFDGYEVSNLGRVRSWHGNGRAMRRAPVVLSGGVDPWGYRRFSAAGGRGPTATFSAHRVAALAFLGPPPTPDHEVAHLSGDPSDARVANLAWATRAENEAHKVAHGTARIGERGTTVKLTVEQVREIRAYWAQKVPIRTIAAHFGVCKSVAWRAATCERWRSVV